MVLSIAVLAGCGKSAKPDSTPLTTEVVLKTQSVTPALVKSLPGFENLEIFPLVSSDDKLPDSPNFVFGAQPDGAALLKNPSGDGFVLITNHEIIRSISRIYLDKTFKPVKGEYLVDAEGGIWKLCSATLATPAEHGFGPVFLTAGEGDPEGRVHAIDPLGAADKKNGNRTLPALGKASLENALPLPKGAFPTKTVVLMTEDENNGQVTMYVSNTVGDLQNGKLYTLRRTNQDPVEKNMQTGQRYEVEFVEIDNAKTQTGAQIAAQQQAKNAIQFARVEDVDYRKGRAENGRDLYFAVTGAFPSDRVQWGRVYRLELDATNPLKGHLSIIGDGSTDPGNNLVNPDNICVTENYVYIQEDGDAPIATPKHDGRVWQYNIGNRQLKPMLEMNHRRDEGDFQRKYNPIGHQGISTWEYGAMHDISEIIGVPNTFLINLQPHTWRDTRFVNADGSAITKDVNIYDNAIGNMGEGGQIVIVRGVPK
ncbi:alkaline phosphatase PhoX [Larkinella ripae]